MIDKYEYNIRQVEWTLFGPIEKISDYKDLLHYLKDAGPEDKLYLKVNSPGGDVSVGQMIVDALLETEAHTTAIIVFPSASMASIIALSCHSLVMKPNTFLMFHTYSTFECGKSNEVLSSTKHFDLSLKGMFDSRVKPFLTQKEINRMHAGEDIYIRHDDTNLTDRIKRHFKS